MPISEENDLSPATIRTLSNLVSMQSKSKPNATEQDLMDFVFGLAFGNRREAIMAQLVKSPEMRIRMLELDASVRSYRTDVRPDKTSNWAQLLERRISQALGFSQRIREWNLDNSWAEVSANTDIETSFARTTLGAILANVQRAGAIPSYAATRAGESSAIQGTEGMGANGTILEVDLEARITQARDLVVQAVLPKNKGATPQIEGRELFLRMIDPAGGFLELGKAKVSEGRWILLVSKFGTVANLEPGFLIPSSFLLSLGRENPRSVGRNHLFTETPDGEVVPLPLIEEPQIVGGELKVTLTVPLALRQRFEKCKLELRVQVGSTPILLGSWPFADWGQDMKTLRVPTPGTTDGAIQSGSVLQTRIVSSR